MLPAFLYIFLGVFDALAFIVLALKMYRMPLFRYKYRIITFAIYISIFSFFIRVVLQIPKFDLPMQYIFFFLFLRWAMGIKVHTGAFISGAGISAYVSIQLVLYYIFNIVFNLSHNVLNENTGMSVYFIQISTIITAYLVAVSLRIFNGGFSFIAEPPHDFIQREDYSTKTNKMLLIGSILSFSTIIFMVIALYAMNSLMCIILSVFTFGVSYLLSDRGDYEDVRTAVELYRQRNKKG